LQNSSHIELRLLLDLVERRLQRLARAIHLRLELLPNLGPIFDFKNIFAQKIGEKIAFLTQNKAKILLKFYHNIGF
jgi:hypothetical protein